MGLSTANIVAGDDLENDDWSSWAKVITVEHFEDYDFMKHVYRRD